MGITSRNLYYSWCSHQFLISNQIGQDTEEIQNTEMMSDRRALLSKYSLWPTLEPSWITFPRS